MPKIMEVPAAKSQMRVKRPELRVPNAALTTQNIGYTHPKLGFFAVSNINVTIWGLFHTVKSINVTI